MIDHEKRIREHFAESARIKVDASEALDTHLDACTGCARTLDALDAEVHLPFHRLAPAAAAKSLPDEPTLQQLVAAAKRLTPGQESDTLGFL